MELRTGGKPLHFDQMLRISVKGGGRMKEYGTAERGRVTDAAMTRAIAASVIGIMLCMACLIGTTWAWYSASLTSGENEITVANFAVDVTITPQNGEDTATPIQATDGTYTLTGGNYTVKLSVNSSTGSATTGFCQVLANGTPYYTGDFNSEFTFTIKVEGSADVKFTPMWGICPTGEGIKTIQSDVPITLAGTPLNSALQSAGYSGDETGGEPTTDEGTDGDDAADGNGSGGESGDPNGGNEPNGESGDGNTAGNESGGTSNE